MYVPVGSYGPSMPVFCFPNWTGMYATLQDQLPAQRPEKTAHSGNRLSEHTRLTGLHAGHSPYSLECRGNRQCFCLMEDGISLLYAP